MKRIQYIIFLGVFLLVVDNAMAQSSRESDTSRKNTVFKSKKVGAKKAKFGTYEQGLKEYEELMKANKKKYTKMAKGMEKPQYSDPLYFGHKKKPKKRPLGKRKFCKECGMVH